MTRKTRMIKPGGFHTGPGFKRTVTVHGRQAQGYAQSVDERRVLRSTVCVQSVAGFLENGSNRVG
ncbi:MAG TPA: hypothetical protein VE955_12720 [Candidatus Dormibacteraeota bacterium]|nr:hypothetical protein [Candidatus Dormibacteraeota bacterium]